MTTNVTRADVIGACALALQAQLAAACAPLPPHLVKDPRIEVGPDCSFAEGQYGVGGPFEGGPAVDIGNGKVGQRLSVVYDSGLCGIENQQLFLMDCTTGQDIVFEGRARQGDGANYGTEELAIQKPQGPLAIGPDVSFEQLASVARAAGIAYQTDTIRARAKAIKRKNRFDPLCGCKLHYPGARGARE